MLNNLSKEIFYYSVIPVAITAVIILGLLIFGKKKSDNYYKYNYGIKVFLSILIVFILSLMIGYTVWVYERVTNLNALSENILYMALLAVLVLSLFLSLVIIVYKLYKSFKEKNDDNSQKEFQN